ncbi:MAG: nitrophenyl compound nitroreductase subunit ArsF family protein [Rikenellaceae bacterium]
MILTLFAATILVSCGAGGTKKGSDKEAKAKVETKAADGVVTLYSFHTNQRCITCKAIEKLTREVVAEMKSDKIKLEVLNISDNWNEAIAEKYEVTWTSLIADNGTRNDLTKMGFSYAKNQPEVFKAKLKEELTKMLK